MTTVEAVHFTDPTCPFAWSAEPQRWRMLWHYGAQLKITTRMVGLSAAREDAAAAGFTPELLIGAYAQLEQRAGMPFDLTPRHAVPASLPACREFVGVRLHAGAAQAEALLRQLRLQQLAHPVELDELAALRAASHAAGIDSDHLDAWAIDPETERELDDDMNAARHPVAAARQLDHKLASWEGGRRYTCPSYVFTHVEDGTTAAVPGFNPPEAYDVAIANVGPQLERAAAATDPLDVLSWAATPLATAEVAAVMGIDRAAAAAALTEAGAARQPLGTDALWTLA